MECPNSFILPSKMSSAIWIIFIIGVIIAPYKWESKSIVFPKYSEEEYSDTFLDRLFNQIYKTG